MKGQTIILPIEHQYLDRLSTYPIGRLKTFSSDNEKFIYVVENFFQKGVTNFMVIGPDLWKYIEIAKSKFGISVIAGGDIDSIEDAKRAFRLGADLIVISKHFYKDMSSIKKFTKVFKNKVICSVDDKSGYIVGTKIKSSDFVKKARNNGISRFIYVDVGLILSRKGINPKKISEISKNFKERYIYAGGVSTKKDIENLSKNGVRDIIIGTAMYDGKINGMSINYDNETGLIPAVIQDKKNNQVLMLGYMNNVSLLKTIETGFVHFWSRSRKRLWMKGEVSGNKLKTVKIFFDCDKDTILIQAALQGKAACHTGKYTCFMDKVKAN